MVPSYDENEDKNIQEQSIYVKELKNPTDSTVRSPGSSSSVSKDETDGLRLIRTKLNNQGLSKELIEMIMLGWRDSTKKQYRSYLNRWISFCTNKGFDPSYYSVTNCLEFLFTLFKQGLSYSAINTARSALSCLFDEPHEILTIGFNKKYL